MSKSASIWSRLAIFRLPRSAEKGQHFQTGGKKKTGAKAQPRYNGFRVISDRVITALQCMSTYKPGTNPLQCSKDMCTEMTLQVGTVIKVLKQPKLPKNANWTYYFNAEINGAYCRSICCIIMQIWGSSGFSLSVCLKRYIFLMVLPMLNESQCERIHLMMWPGNTQISLYIHTV